MLTTLLLALGALLAAPPQDGAVAATATGSDAQALTALRAAAARMYRPEDHGLVSLEFVVPYEETRESLEAMAASQGMAAGDLDPVERLADVHVQWSAGAQPVIEVDLASPLPAPLVGMREQLEAFLPPMGDQLLTAARGRVVDLERFLGSYDVSPGTPEGALTRFVLTRRADAQVADAPTSEVTWYLGADGLPARSEVEVIQDTPMGQMTLKMSSQHTWRPSGRDDGSVLLDQVNVVMDMGFMGTQTQTTSYHYEELGGFPVLTSLTELAVRTTPQGEVPPTQRTTRLSDVKVNGVAAR